MDSTRPASPVPPPPAHAALQTTVRIPVGPVVLAGDLNLPQPGCPLVLFAHGSGSSRHSRRNQFVARRLQAEGVGTLLFDLLTTREEVSDARDGHLRFDIPLLAERLIAVTEWYGRQSLPPVAHLGYFGSSTGAAAALVAAAALGSRVGAVVSRGGRPDLAGDALARVASPTLLIVGGADDVVLQLNRSAQRQLPAGTELAVIPGATHLFEEPGALDQVAALAARWFHHHLARP